MPSWSKSPSSASSGLALRSNCSLELVQTRDALGGCGRCQRARALLDRIGAVGERKLGARHAEPARGDVAIQRSQRLEHERAVVGTRDLFADVDQLGGIAAFDRLVDAQRRFEHAQRALVLAQLERAVGAPGRQRRRRPAQLGRDRVTLQDARERRRGQTREAHALAARSDRRQQPIRALAQQHEVHAHARLFQRLEQRVGGFRVLDRERHVGLREDHERVAGFERRELRERQDLVADQLDR